MIRQKFWAEMFCSVLRLNFVFMKATEDFDRGDTSLGSLFLNATLVEDGTVRNGLSSSPSFLQ